MTAQYVPGRGYTVRDSRGRIIAHSLTAAQRDALLCQQHKTLLDLSVLKLNG